MALFGNYISAGYQQITVTTTQSLVLADKTAFISIIPEAQAVRWRDDGIDPTATVGQPLAVGQELRYDSRSMAKLRIIAQVAGGIINVTSYGF